MSDIIGSSVILKYNNNCVFEIRKKDKWIRDEEGNINIGISCIGGSIEKGETPLDALIRESREEAGVNISIKPIYKCFLVDDDYKIHDIKNEYNHDNVFYYWTGYNNKRICTYYGITSDMPKAKDVGGLILVDLKTLFDSFSEKVSLKGLIDRGAVVIQKDSIPKDARISPTGTVDVLYELYKRCNNHIQFLLDA